jgi:hypothetical protein
MDLSKYMKDIEALKIKSDEAAAEYNAARIVNDSIQEKYDAMVKAKFSEDGIRAALETEFGVARVKRARGPNQAKTPTEVEIKLMQAMDSEGKSKTEIFKDAAVEVDEENKAAMVRLANLGLVANLGGKGAGAKWALTSKGGDVVAEQG